MKFVLFFSLSLLILLLAACGRDDAESATGGAAQEAPAQEAEDAETAADSMRQTADRFLAETAEERQALIDEMRSALETATSGENLRDTATNALGNLARGEGDQSRDLLEQVNEARQDVQERLEAVREAKPENWDEVKAHAREALDRLNGALAKLREN